EEPLHFLEVFIEATSPRLPRKVFGFADGRGRVFLGDDAVHFNMAEFGVWEEEAVVKKRAADPGAGGEDENAAGLVASRAEAHFGETGCIGVVDELHGASGGFGENHAAIDA